MCVRVIYVSKNYNVTKKGIKILVINIQKGDTPRSNVVRVSAFVSRIIDIFQIFGRRDDKDSYFFITYCICVVIYMKDSYTRIFSP